MSKATAVRKILTQNPNATTEEIRLAARRDYNENVSPNYVSKIRGRAGFDTLRRRRQLELDEEITTTELLEAKRFVDYVGGLEMAHETLQGWAKLTNGLRIT